MNDNLVDLMEQLDAAENLVVGLKHRITEYLVGSDGEGINAVQSGYIKINWAQLRRECGSKLFSLD